MQNDTKIIVLILTLCALIWYSFSKMTIGNYTNEGSDSLSSIYIEKYNNDFDEFDDFENYQYKERDNN